MLDVDNTSVCLFFYCSGKCQAPSAHHGATNCSFKAYSHTFTNQISSLLLLPTASSLFSLSFCRLASFILLKHSCLLDLGSSRTCWNRFTFWPAFRKRALWVTEMISWLKNGWKMLLFFFLAHHLPGQRKGCVFHSLTAHVERSPLCQREWRK